MEAQERMQSPNLSVLDRRRVVCRLGVDYQLAVARLLVAALHLDMMSILTLLAITRANMREVAGTGTRSGPMPGSTSSRRTRCAGQSASTPSPSNSVPPTRPCAAT